MMVAHIETDSVHIGIESVLILERESSNNISVIISWVLLEKRKLYAIVFVDLI